MVGEDRKPQSFDPRRWSLLEWKPTRGKDQADVWSEGSNSKPVNFEAGCAETEDEDEEMYAFPQCAPVLAPAAAPNGRATQPPSLTPAATSEERTASPAPLTTAGISGGRTTPTTVASVNEGSGPIEFEGSGVPVVQASVVGTRIVFPIKMPKRVGWHLREGWRLTKLYPRLCWVRGKL